MGERLWQFFIDVGGTFTDVVANSPNGQLVTYKLLSSGVVRGTVHSASSNWIQDDRRILDPLQGWAGYQLSIHHHNDRRLEAGTGATPILQTTVNDFDAATGRFYFDETLGLPKSNYWTYELSSYEEAPVLAIRLLMGLQLTDPIEQIEVRLGTTRATNALLERKGAKVAFVTTRGFGDALKIGHQDRPHLFKLHIQKRDELTSQIIEVDERLDAQGNILQNLDEDEIRKQLQNAAESGMQTLAICLLHSHINPVHEQRIASIASSIASSIGLGFENISLSSNVSRLEGFVSRGDTTVVDAYLSPVIHHYIESIRNSIPQARLHLMTSSGGLVSADAISGKDTILSGPAGGVVACAHVAQQAGYDRAIGFDMGGTSTDVCRIDPPPASFEYSSETVKAGVRIKTPMLAVETVASGGGSICVFDGQKLTVGPESAGANPGPACYGSGGPLTVTDMNVYLGRVVSDHFPFQLDRAIVEHQLQSLCSRIQNETTVAYTTIELAEGFLQIANANMASAIKRISLEKGYDAREFTLVTFGGAGGQHACAIANLLGIRRILHHPLAGILSAVGMGVADIKRIEEQSVSITLDPKAEQNLRETIANLTDALRQSLRDEGVHEASLAEPVCSIDLCYAGQNTLITVPATPIQHAREHFEQSHRQLYGYVHENRSIEIRVARVELKAMTSPMSMKVDNEQLSPDAANLQTPMTVHGQSREVPLYQRKSISSRQKISGPAIVIEETSTVVLDEGWDATVDELGNLILSPIQSSTEKLHETVSSDADPIQLELFNHRFQSIATQMGTTLRRTALSTNVKERLDFSCAIFTPTGDLVVNAPHIPVHLGGMSDCIKCLIEDVSTGGQAASGTRNSQLHGTGSFQYNFSPGDVYITNDPYRGGSHLNDITVVTPIHDANGKNILFYVASRAHHAEIGGTRPGSMPPDSTSLAEEGVLIRTFAWIKQGKVQQEAMRDLLTSGLYPSRNPEENLADIAAAVAANQRGVQELHTLVDQFGVETVHGYMKHIQNAAEDKMREALTKIPDGEYRFQDQMDDQTPIQLTITMERGRAKFDFEGTGGVHPGNLNANRAIVTSAVMYCLRCLMDEEIPLNAGVLEPIEIVLPECFLNPPFAHDPTKCPAVVGGNVETSQRIVDTIFGALQLVAASSGTMNNLLMGDDTFGYYETICGGSGAGANFDGTDAVHTHMTNTRLTDPEVLESRYPVRLLQFSIRENSGGSGKHRGGNGVIRTLEFLKPLDVSLLTQRRLVAPYGLCGGENGKPGMNVLRRKNSTQVESLQPITHIHVESGDQLTLETPGGGGYGTAAE